MTLIISIACTDGVIIGADSASTDMSAGMRQPTQKLHRIGSLPLIFGGSGDVGLLQKIIPEFSQVTALPNSAKNLRKKLKSLIFREQGEAADGYVRIPGRPVNPPVAVFLFAAIMDRKPQIIEIDEHGSDTGYEGKREGGFYAIGSGKSLACAIMRPHLFTDRTIGGGKVLAYRILKDSIEMASAGLSEPIHIHTIDLNGAITQVPADELRALGETCNMWKEMEQDCLGKVLAPKLQNADLMVPHPPAAAAAPVPAPSPAPAPAPASRAAGPMISNKPAPAPPRTPDETVR